MRFYIDIEGLWLKLRIWWIINAGNGSSAAKMVQVGCQFCEFRPSTLLLKILFVSHSLLEMRVEQFSNLLVLLLHMVEVLLASIKVVLVFSAVVASETIK